MGHGILFCTLDSSFAAKLLYIWNETPKKTPLVCLWTSTVKLKQMRKITLKIKKKQVVVFQLFRFYNEAKPKNHENVCDLNLFDRRGHQSFVCRGVSWNSTGWSLLMTPVCTGHDLFTKTLNKEYLSFVVWILHYQYLINVFNIIPGITFHLSSWTIL